MRMIWCWQQRVVMWRGCLETKRLKLNVKKTKFLVFGRNLGEIEKMGKWLCVVVGKPNSVQCMSCDG